MYHIDYQYLRPKKAIALQQWYDERFEEIQELSVWSGTNATILPLRKLEGDGLLFGRGGVVDCDGNYVALSSIPRRVEHSYSFENSEFQDKKVVYCGYLVHHWGHFLVEAVARLWYFLEKDPSIDKYVFFLGENETREIRGNYRFFLELLGIWDKLEFINKPVTYREVLIPQLAFHCRNYWSPKFLAIFDAIANNVIADSNWKPVKKIYYSRSQLQKGLGYEFGQEALDNFFEKNGYTILYPEKVPLAQMIFYIRNAEVVATLSGSLPHNMLFAANGQKLEILERCVLNNDFQVNVNKMRQLQATYIDVNIAIYTVDMCGPFIMGYNKQLEHFAIDRNMLPPDEEFLSEKHYRNCFVNYMKAYKDLYRYQWYMEEWYTPLTDYLWEAYQDGHELFADYLNGSKPFAWHHYFEVHYWKQLVKRIMIRLNLR